MCCCIKRKNPNKQLDSDDSEAESSNLNKKKNKENDPQDRIRNKKPLTEAQKKKARENWGKLRAHIK